MHLAIDAVGIKHSGGAVVLLDLLDAALEDDVVSRVTLFSSPEHLRRFELPTSPVLREVPRPREEASYLRRVLWSQRGLSRAAGRVGADVVLAMTGIGRSGRGARVPTATFVQQALPFSREAMARLGVRRRAQMQVVWALAGRSCRSAAAVYVQTDTMRRWVIDAFGLEERRVEVVYPFTRELRVPDSDVPASLSPMADVPADRRLLYVGNDSHYKNVRVALSGLDELRRRLPGATLFVTWPADHPELRRPGAVGLGYLDEPTLAQAYDLATALMQPSLVESGPLTMTEAMSLGTPVLVADRPYAHDICETAAVFFDPTSAESLVHEAHRLLTDATLRATLVDSGRQLVERRRASQPYQAMLRHLRGLVDGRVEHRR